MRVDPRTGLLHAGIPGYPRSSAICRRPRSCAAGRPGEPMNLKKPRFFAATLFIAAVLASSVSPVHAMRAPELTPEDAAALKKNFATSIAKLKGPYTENFCVCRGT